MNKKILVSFDHFRIGGRETYIAAYGEYLKRRGYELHLVAETVSNPLAEKLFSSICNTPQDSSGDSIAEESLVSRLRLGIRYLRQLEPDLIWVQHYSSMPALVWSLVERIPLMLTIHGPLFGVGRVGDRLDLLGISHHLASCPRITVVSEEIAAQLEKLGLPRDQIKLLPNAISRSDFSALSPAIGDELYCVMLARRQKLEHLRAGVLVFSALKRRFPGARLKLFTGYIHSEAPLRDLPKRREELSRVLGRKWLLRHPQAFAALGAIELQSLTSEPMREIEAADVVFGMGRVLLEAIAAGKVPVLIGYERPISVVTAANYARLAVNNLSGREQADTTPAKIAAEIANVLSSRRSDVLGSLQDQIALEPWGNDLCELLRHMPRSDDNANEVLGDTSETRRLRISAGRLLNGRMSLDEWLETLENSTRRSHPQLIDLLIERD